VQSLRPIPEMLTDLRDMIDLHRADLEAEVES